MMIIRDANQQLKEKGLLIKSFVKGSLLHALLSNRTTGASYKLCGCKMLCDIMDKCCQGNAKLYMRM